MVSQCAVQLGSITSQRSMKRVVLEILNGTNAGQRIWLRLGQVIKLGSTDRSDFMIESDVELAPEHLTIGHLPQGCFIECLDSQNRLAVNGITTERIRLHDGDLVVVGTTRMQAHITDQEPAADSRRESAPTDVRRLRKSTD